MSSPSISAFEGIAVSIILSSVLFRLRAKFASDEMKNAIHGSSSVMKAKAVIEEYFPEVELNPDGTVKGKNILKCRPLGNSAHSLS